MGQTDIGWSGRSQSLCPLPIQDELLLDVGSFKVIILGNVLELGFNSLDERKPRGFKFIIFPWHSFIQCPAQAGHCFLMEIRILSQVTALRDCCCLGFAFPFILAISSPPLGNTSCSLFSPSGNLGRARGFGWLCSFGDIPAQ